MDSPAVSVYLADNVERAALELVIHALKVDAAQAQSKQVQPSHRKNRRYDEQPALYRCERQCDQQGEKHHQARGQQRAARPADDAKGLA